MKRRSNVKRPARTEKRVRPASSGLAMLCRAARAVRACRRATSTAHVVPLRFINENALQVTRHHPEASVGPGHDERSGPARRRVLTMSPCLTAISGVFGLSIFAVVQLSRWCAPTRTPRACAAAVASWHVVRARGRGSGGPAAAGQVELDVRGTSLSGTSHHLHYEGWCTAGWARRRAQ